MSRSEHLSPRALRQPTINARLLLGLISAALTLTSATVVGAAAPPAVSAYAGKYFHDVVGGYRFFANPTVTRAISTAITDPTARGEILKLETSGVTGPIRVSHGAATAVACFPRHCDSNRFVIYVSTTSTAAAVCYMSNRIGQGKSAWYLSGKPPAVRNSPCPEDSAPPRSDLFSTATGGQKAPTVPPVGRLKPGEASYVQNAVFLPSSLDARPMHTFLPQRTRAQQVRGEGTIECDVAAGGRLQNCAITDETPGGYGFGEAAMKLQSGRILDMARSKARPGQRVSMTAMFFPPYPAR